MLFFVIITFQDVLSSKLIYSSFTDDIFNSASGWETSKPITGSLLNCQSKTIFGGFAKNDWITNIIQLPPHHTIYIKFQLWRLGIWNQETFSIFIDHNFSFKDTFTQNGSLICSGNNNRTRIDEIEIKHIHNFQTVFIIITTNLNQGMRQKSWGIRNFYLEIDECFPGCNSCNQFDQRWECITWKEAHSALNSVTIQNFNSEGWMIQKNNEIKQEISICPIPLFGGLNITGKDCKIFAKYQLPIHNVIKIKLRIAFINSWDKEYIYLTIDGEEKLQESYYFLNGLVNFCGERFIDTFKIYEIYQNHQSSTINIEITNNLNQDYMDEAIGIRDFQLFINTYGFCGDGFQAENEECDDGNIFPFDGCFNCLYSCVENCKFCHLGLCLECEDEYYFEVYLEKCVKNQFKIITTNFGNTCKRCNGFCSFKCSYCYKGDCFQCFYDPFQFQNTVYNEDKNLEHFNDFSIIDGQYDLCNFDCSAYCQECIQGYCLSCQPYYQLIEQYCIPICGDGIIVDQEQCDDQNFIPYDGCLDCLYSCPQNCKTCQKGVCLDQCDFGYYQIDSECVSLCGDGIVVEQEECEDILDPLNCQNCILKCQNCDQCSQGQCSNCKYGFKLNMNYNDSCQLACGDGQLDAYEQCDDGNVYNGDGCSNQCFIENNYYCRKYLHSLSECTYLQWPLLQAKMISQYFNSQEILLSFSQEVKTKIKLNFCQHILATLIQEDPKLYSINIETVQEAQEQISQVQYILSITYFSKLDQEPILKITLDQLLYNQYDLSVFNNEIQLKLPKPQYLNKEEKKASNILKNVNQYIIYFLGSGLILSLIQGNLDLFSCILDILQQQSYLKYINVDYPINLLIYFESSNLISIFNLLNSIQFYDYFDLILDYYKIDCDYKLKFYELNADLFTNLFQSQLVQIILILISYCFMKLIIYLLNQFEFNIYQIFGECTLKIIHQIKQFFLFQIILFQKKGLEIIFESNFFDLIFCSLLQIKFRNNYQNNTRTICAIIISSFIIFWYLEYIIISKNSKFKKIHFLQKVIFLSILVLLQENEIIQMILLNLIHLIFLTYIIKFKKVIKSNEYNQLVLNEFIFFIFTFSIFVYQQQLKIFYLEYDMKIKFGWFHISILITALLFCILIQLKLQFIKIKNYFNKQYGKKLQVCANPWPLKDI